MRRSAMLIDNLKSYGLPEVVVGSWRQRLGEELLPLQRKAVVESGLLRGENILISAPTSAGKTFCGELAAASAIFNRRKALFLVPLKSIAEERFYEFSERYSRLGIRVVIATSDHREHEHDLETGNFDVGIVIYEKFNQLLIRNLDMLATVGLIVIDEIQMLGDTERGADLELAILKILVSGYTPQIVALSAVVENSRELAEWLGCKLLTDSYRPIELRHGVLYQRRFRYRAAGGNQNGEEEFAECDSDDEQELLLANVANLVDKEEQVIVFLKAKRACEMFAVRLAESNFWPESGETIARLQRETATVLGRRLIETLHSGVAFHHADLSHRQRRIIERGYLDKETRVLVATTTLAMGVNLPAQTVFIDSYKYRSSRSGQRAIIVPLNWGDYEAMSGRAGRYGKGVTFGRSVLIAGSDIEAETLWNLYIDGKAESLISALESCSLSDVILDLIASKAVTEKDELYHALAMTFHAKTADPIEVKWIEEALEQLEAQRMIFVDGDSIVASPAGQLASLRGLSVGSVTRLAEWVGEYDGTDRLSWLYAISTLSDFNVAGVYLDSNDDFGMIYRKRLIEYLHSNTHAAPWLKKLIDPDYMLTDNELRCLKMAMLMHEWTMPVETVVIETRYHTHAGAILQMTETASWLIESVAELAELLHKAEDQGAGLRQLAHVVAKGFELPETIFDAEEFTANDRDLVWRLFNAGWTNAAHFREDRKAKLEELVGSHAAAQLMEKFRFEDTKNGSDTESKEETMPMLRLRGLVRGERVKIYYNDAEIELTPKSFNYLYKLGVARFLKADGWMSKDEIEPGFNQAKNIYRVKQELKKFGSGLEDRIENNKSGFYRLNLKPEQIKIDVESMVTYTDLELVELTKRFSMARAS